MADLISTRNKIFDELKSEFIKKEFQLPFNAKFSSESFVRNMIDDSFYKFRIVKGELSEIKKSRVEIEECKAFLVHTWFALSFHTMI